MNNCPIFISSADSYSDLWPLFFDLFKMNWPEYEGQIYLNTHEKNFRYDGLNIKCTRVGRLNSFGRTFRAGLDKIQSDHILLMMIDYIFMGPVNNLKVKEYHDRFISSDLDTLCLIFQEEYRELAKTGLTDLRTVVPPSPFMFSFQMAFWKKEVLYEMALPHETPWTSEWYGTLRANRMKIKMACLSEEVQQPIPYDAAGCLHKGKWLGNAVEYLQQVNYPMDFNKRGYYKEPPYNFKNRLKTKVSFVIDGLSGSYWDLMKRKEIH